MELKTSLRNDSIIPWLIGTVVLIITIACFGGHDGIFYALSIFFLIGFVILFRLYETFTDVVRINNDQVEIEYTQLFKKKFISLPISTTTISLNCKTDRKQYRYYSLSFYEKGKQLHRISEDEGYSKDDFAAFIHEFSVAAQH
jgi:hypothetical protein